MTTSKSFNISKYFSENSTIENIAKQTTPIDIQVYPTVDSLPLSNVIPGSKAYVQETRRLYLRIGTGWYSISLINNTPSFDSDGTPQEIYRLDSSESLIIRLSANDPEDIPIQWDYAASDSAQYFADIVQDSSVFTIIPKDRNTIQQYDSSGGIFNITFKASDGVDLAAKISEISLILLDIPVKSNLIFYVDANEDKSYTGVGVSVRDLYTGQKGTIVDANYVDNTPSYFNFNNNDGYITFGTIETSDPLQLSSEVIDSGFTIMFTSWIPGDDLASFARIVDKSTDTGGTEGYDIQTSSAGNLVQLQINGAERSTGVLLNPYIWEVYALTVDYTNNEIKWYRNGILTNTSTSMIGPPDNVQAELRFGGTATDNLYRYTGRLGNYITYNRTLSQSEVSAMYNHLVSDYLDNHNVFEVSLQKPSNREFDYGTILNSSFERGSNAVFFTDVVFPSSPTDGVLFQLGGTVLSCWVGIRDSGTVLRFRSGDGSALSASTADTVVLDIANFPKDDQLHNIAWEFQIDPGRIRVWIDEELVGEGYTTGNGPLDGNVWAGTADGGFGTGTSSAGEPSTDWPAVINTHLRYYQNTLIT